MSNKNKETKETKETKEVEKKAPKVVIEIIRGRMPVAIAAAIKLTAGEDDKDADIAATYRTTNGKVSDIRNDRNFSYIKEGFKTTKDMVVKAQGYADQLEDGESVMEKVNSFESMTDEEEAALKPKPKPKADKKPKKEKKAKAKKEAPEPEKSDDELEDDLDDLLD